MPNPIAHDDFGSRPLDEIDFFGSRAGCAQGTGAATSVASHSFDAEIVAFPFDEVAVAVSVEAILDKAGEIGVTLIRRATEDLEISRVSVKGAIGGLNE